MNSNVYDIINKIQRFLPAVGAFYLTLVAIWGFPYGDEINKTIAAVATLLAVILEISTGKWKDEYVITTAKIEDFKGDD